MHNQVCQTLHNQGDTNVENNESLLIIPPSFTNVSTNRQSTSNPVITSSSSKAPPIPMTNITLTSLQVPTISPTSSSSRPITPTPTATTINTSSMLATFQKLSLCKQSAFQSSMNTVLGSSSTATTTIPTPNTNTSPSLIFDITRECSTLSLHSIRNVYGIHTYILELARNN